MLENKLTDKRLRAIKPTPSERTYADGGGLWIRILPQSKGGAINFYYRFELAGRERRFNCGSYPDTSLAEARARRNAARELVKAGIDPVERKQADREAQQAAELRQKMEKTVQQLFDDWKRVYLSAHRADGGKEVEETMEYDVLSHIGKMRARDVRLAHVVELIDRPLDRGARRKANLVLSLTRQMFRHGLRRGFVEADPTLGLTRKDAGGLQTPVQRHLTLEEIKELRQKMSSSGLQARYQAAVLFLLATGARVGELLRAKQDDIDVTAATWLIPAENSKNRRAHLIHLSAFALAQLPRMMTFDQQTFVLAGRKEDSGLDAKTLSKAIRDRMRTKPLKNRIKNKGSSLVLANGEWSPHDLRRTLASRMGDLGVAPHVIEKCLNHTPGGIVAVYQRQEYMAERRAAFGAWGRTLSALFLDKPTPYAAPKPDKRHSYVNETADFHDVAYIGALMG